MNDIDVNKPYSALLMYKSACIMSIDELNIPYSKLTVIDKMKKRMKIYICIFLLRKYIDLGRLLLLNFYHLFFLILFHNLVLCCFCLEIFNIKNNFYVN